MQKKHLTQCKSTTKILACSLLFFLADSVIADSVNLEKHLKTVRHAKRKDDTELIKLETQCLDLIADHNSPSEKGKIYSTISLMYSDRGYKPGKDPKIDKTIKYSMKALEYPLDPLAACQMYARASDALMAEYRRDPEKKFVEVRRKVIDLCLKGLKLAIDSKAPKERPKPPGAIARVNVPPGTLLYERLMKEREQQIKDRARWEYQDEFYLVRYVLFRRCVLLYSREPYDIEEFKNKASRILKEHEKSANELITAIDARITRQRDTSKNNNNSTN